MKNINKFETKFIKKEKIAKNTYTFYFERNKQFNFSPGQYVKIFLEIENPDARGSSRYFTISSSPREENLFLITTKIIKSSFKLKLRDLKKGEKIKYIGPIGYFNFNENNKKPKIFLAGGIGITPFHSIIKTLSFDKSLLKVCLLVSFSGEEEAVFYKELKKIESENQNIKIIYSLTHEIKKGFEKGRIDKSLIEKYCPDFKISEFFITGPPQMTEELFETVKSLGIKEDNIFKEDFSGY